MRTYLSSLLFMSALFAAGSAFSQVNVSTQHNDLKRTGWMNKETKLTQANVDTATFGKVFSRTVDDQVYAQPLVRSSLRFGRKLRNVVYVATVNNTVYAFDADKDTAATPLWKVSLTPTGYRSIKNSDMTGACGGFYKDFSGNMGIVGTPVIDTTTNTLYVVARSVTTTAPKTFVQYLYAIDIKTGAERPNSPVYITATVDGTGDGSVGGKLAFNQQHENPRPGLLLYKGVVYISWASHCDWSPYHGWVIGYDAGSLQQKYVYVTTPNGGLGGIWMSGQAPAVDDDGFIYLSTGNGSVGQNGNANDTINRGESILKLSTASGKLKVVDFFTPHNYQQLENADLDYGVDGVTLIPNTNLSLSGSKQSYLYVVNTKSMGRTSSADTGAVEIIDINAEFNGEKHLHGSPVYFRAAGNKEYIYAWAEDGLLKQIPFKRQQQFFDTANTIIGTTILPQGMPGSMLSLSSNGLKAGTGILWATHPLQGNANQAVVPGILQAFSADDVTHELWNSNQNAARDGIGKFGKFVCPTIANGKVYMATFSNVLNVYGLLPKKTAAANKSPDVKAKEVLIAADNDKLEVFPNPAHMQVTINFTNKNSEAQKTLIMLLNSTGKMVYKQSTIVNPGSNTLNVQLPEYVANGLYLLQLTTADGVTATKKLVIEK